MLLSLSTACLYSSPLRMTCALAAECGFDGIELVTGPETWLRGARTIASLVRAYGLTLLSVHQTLLPLSPRGRGPWRMVEAAELALALGCPRVVIHDHGAIRWADPTAQTWLCVLALCRERLVGSETRLALENPGLYSTNDRRNTLAAAPVLADFARRHDLDLTLDTCHVGTAGLGLLDVYAALRDRLANVHLSDLKLAPPALKHQAYETLFLHHQLPGEGVLPLAPLLTQLSADGFTGPITLEASPAALRGWSPRQVRSRLAQAVAYVRSAERVSAALMSAPALSRPA